MSRPGYEVAPIALGTNTDPYQPIEERWRITRSILELLLETRHPFTITTKSDRVLRDLDLHRAGGEARARLGGDFGDLARSRRSTGRSSRARPRRASGWRRSRRSTRPACRAHVAIAPVIPQITDHELEAIVEAAAEARRARRASIFRSACRTRSRPCSAPGSTSIIPDRAAKVMATIQSMRGGRDNDPNFFTRMRGQGPWAELLRTRFDIACRKRTVCRRSKFPLRRDLFEPPQGDQLRLL